MQDMQPSTLVIVDIPGGARGRLGRHAQYCFAACHFRAMRMNGWSAFISSGIMNASYLFD
jgi:hypothetical protein